MTYTCATCRWADAVTESHVICVYKPGAPARRERQSRCHCWEADLPEQPPLAALLAARPSTMDWEDDVLILRACGLVGISSPGQCEARGDDDE